MSKNLLKKSLYILFGFKKSKSYNINDVWTSVLTLFYILQKAAVNPLETLPHIRLAALNAELHKPLQDLHAIPRRGKTLAELQYLALIWRL